jgi:DNA segregation ATPase FtsK/SpoIIIE, S-DNA-T family
MEGLQLTLLCMAVAVYYLLKVMDRINAQRARMVTAAPAAESPVLQSVLPPLPLRGERGPGVAAANAPAGIAATLRMVAQRPAHDPLELPLGWYVDSQDQLDVAVISLNGNSKFAINHMLITGQTRSGKDNLAILWALTLAERNTPEQVQICAIDGKGLDWAPWRHKAHGWRIAIQPEDIPAAMQAVTEERQRRGALLLEEGVTKWENSRLRIPLLWVFISELALLESALGSSKALDQWLNAELAAGAAFGIRFCVATQDAANFGTRWRRQIALHIAGYQPSPTADQPNTGASTSDLLQRGAVPPSQLPPPPSGAGYFCLVTGAQATNIRAPYLSDEERASAVGRLPSRPGVRQPQAASVQPGMARTQGTPATTTDLLHLLVTNQPLPIAQEAEPVVVMTAPKTPSLAEVINSKTLGELEKDTTFVGAVRDAYGRLGTVRQVVIEVFGSYSGSRDQTVTRVLRAVGELPERAPAPAVSAA